MTAVFYLDRRSTSPNGRYLLEARSPHNGTIPHRNEKPASDQEFAFKYRESQKEFRYQLLDQATGRVLWERWQPPEGEDSPHEVVVSDDGWSVLRLHGFEPEIVAVAPSGQDALHVVICHPNEAMNGDLPWAGSKLRWGAEHLMPSTAGTYWSDDSWRYFFTHLRGHYFVWRTWWGQRLVLDLDRARVLGAADQADPVLAAAFVAEEKRDVERFLSLLTPQVPSVRDLLAAPQDEERPETPLLAQLGSLKAAVHLTGVYRMAHCVDLLRPWEALDWPGYSTGTTAMGQGWWLEVQYLRPILQHSLRLLDQEPQGFAACHFRDTDKRRFPLPERVHGRATRIADLRPDMTAEQVLALVGAPDFVHRRRQQVGRFYRSPEDWEYDLRTPEGWITVRLTWEEAKSGVRITSLTQGPSYWLETSARDEPLLGSW